MNVQLQLHYRSIFNCKQAKATKVNKDEHRDFEKDGIFVDQPSFSNLEYIRLIFRSCRRKRAGEKKKNEKSIWQISTRRLHVISPELLVAVTLPKPPFLISAWRVRRRATKFQWQTPLNGPAYAQREISPPRRVYQPFYLLLLFFPFLLRVLQWYITSRKKLQVL